MLSYATYRTNFVLRTIIPVFIFPLLITYAHCQLIIPSSTPNYVSVVLYVVSIPLYNVFRIIYDDFSQHREAKRLGAKMVPRLKGRWIGNLDLVLKIGGKKLKEGEEPRIPYYGQRLEDMFRYYGCTTINTRMLWTDQFITIDEGVLKYVLATGFEHFNKGDRSKEMREPFLGNGIFNRDGSAWKAHRAMTRPFFAKERISDFENFESYVARSLGIVERQCIEGGDVLDFQDLFARLTVDFAGEFLFKKDVGTLSLPLSSIQASASPSSPRAEDRGSTLPGSLGTFASAFEECQSIVIERQQNDLLWPVKEWFGDKMQKPVGVIRDWLEDIVRSAVEGERENRAKRSGDEEAVGERSLLEWLAYCSDDVEMIKTELLNILMAARDSTSSLLTFVIYFFTQHPDVLARLRKEVLDVCPPGRVPSIEDIRSMKYLRAVLNETLRVFPPSHTFVRASGPSSVVIPPTPSNPDKLYIPPNKIIAMVPLIIHRRKDLWGDDSEKFDPGRWMSGDPRVERMVGNPYMFVPFNAGPRICLGQQFTLNQASYFIFRLLQTYSSFELCQPPHAQPPRWWAKDGRGRAKVEKVWLMGGFVLFVKGGLWVKVGKAKEGDE